MQKSTYQLLNVFLNFRIKNKNAGSCRTFSSTCVCLCSYLNLCMTLLVSDLSWVSSVQRFLMISKAAHNFNGIKLIGIDRKWDFCYNKSSFSIKRMVTGQLIVSPIQYKVQVAIMIRIIEFLTAQRTHVVQVYRSFWLTPQKEPKLVMFMLIVINT